MIGRTERLVGAMQPVLLFQWCSKRNGHMKARHTGYERAAKVGYFTWYFQQKIGKPSKHT